MNVFKGLAFVFFISIPNQLFSKHFFIDYLSEKGYVCVKMESYKEISNYINSEIDTNEHIVYTEKEDMAFGFIIFKDSHPYLFVATDKFITVFLPNPLIDENNLYSKILNNIYSSSYIDLENKTISYIMFNFGFQYTKTIINSYKKEGGGYLKSSIRVDAIPYPQFTDTTKIKYYYGNFCADVNSRMKKLLFEKEEPHDSKMMGLFWGLVDYRSKILQPDKK